MTCSVVVRTPSRLHFGLTSLGHDHTTPQFGGVGAMIEGPAVCLRIEPADEFSATGPLRERVELFATTISQRWQLSALPAVKIEVVTAPREHIGLGAGTQLGHAVAAGLGEALGRAWRDPHRLARLTQRGRRSAVGTYGFLLGGLIVDGGHAEGETLGRLVHRSDLPTAWRFVLFMPRTDIGCAGSAEEQAFAKLPPVARDVTVELERIAMDELVPAAETANFHMFSDALYRYGTLAGGCFAPVQGGVFGSPRTTALIAWLRHQGLAGVGQSSWGPTVFALEANQQSAEQLAAEFACYPHASDYDVLITPAQPGTGPQIESRINIA